MFRSNVWSLYAVKNVTQAKPPKQYCFGHTMNKLSRFLLTGLIKYVFYLTIFGKSISTSKI